MKFRKDYISMYRTADSIIKHYDKNHIRRWAKQGWHKLDDNIMHDIDAGTDIASFPYSPDGPMDDCLITTPVDKADIRTVANNYMRTFKEVRTIASECEKLFNGKTIPKKYI